MGVSSVQVSMVESIPVAVIRQHASRAELGRVIPEACGRVWEFVRSRQLRAGRNVAIYWDGSIRLEVGVEISDTFEDTQNVVQSATPAGAAASVVHLGPYDQLAAAHHAILK